MDGDEVLLRPTDELKEEVMTNGWKPRNIQMLVEVLAVSENKAKLGLNIYADDLPAMRSICEVDIGGSVQFDFPEEIELKLV